MWNLRECGGMNQLKMCKLKIWPALKLQKKKRIFEGLNQPVFQMFTTKKLLVSPQTMREWWKLGLWLTIGRCQKPKRCSYQPKLDYKDLNLGWTWLWYSVVNIPKTKRLHASPFLEFKRSSRSWKSQPTHVLTRNGIVLSHPRQTPHVFLELRLLLLRTHRIAGDAAGQIDHRRGGILEVTALVLHEIREVSAVLGLETPKLTCFCLHFCHPKAHPKKMERMEVSHLKSLCLLLVAQKQTERICSKKSIQPSDTAHNSPPACGPHLACPEDCRKHWGGNNFGHQTELPRWVASL